MANNNLPSTQRNSGVPQAVGGERATGQFVSISIGGQMFGIPVLMVHDILGPQRITRIPLAPPEIAGSLNLRGRIVTAIHVRRRLGLDPLPIDQKSMSVVVEHHGDLYSLIVDGVGEVLTLDLDRFEPHPPTIPARIREISAGIYQLKDTLLVVLDVSNLLDFIGQEPA